MRLVMTLLVRDEESILEQNIEYHLSRGVDYIIATDNLSVDETADILRFYEKQGVLRYIYEPSDDYSQDRWVTRMARMAAEECKADWVIHSDADEFWWPNHGVSLKDVFASVPDGIEGLVVQRENFFPTPDRVGDTAFSEQFVYRDTRSANPIGLPLPPKMCHRASPVVEVEQGNHGFSVNGRIPRVQKTGAMTIFHFPYRGYEHFSNRIATGGAAYARNDRFTEDIGRTWRVLHEKAKSGSLRDHYDELAGSGWVRRRIAEGRLVHDRRLADYMAARAGGVSLPSRVIRFLRTLAGRRCAVREGSE